MVFFALPTAEESLELLVDGMGEAVERGGDCERDGDGDGEGRHPFGADDSVFGRDLRHDEGELAVAGEGDGGEEAGPGAQPEEGEGEEEERCL